MDALCTAVRRLAREAGAITLRYYGAASNGAGVDYKADDTPVTRADREADAHIVAGLATLAPDIPVVSEEGTIAPYEARRAWRRFWLVDPLDGTKEFIRGLGEFTVNIALIADGSPVLGVIYAPALDLMYWAYAGGGAWREAQGESVRVYATRRAAGEPRVVVESRSHPSPDLETFLSTIDVARRVGVGSSLKFCWLADGQADLYARFGPTMEWDVAAGDCIYRESGREGPNPSPLRYNKPDLRNGAFVLGQ